MKNHKQQTRSLNKSKLSFSQVGGLKTKEYDSETPEGAIT
jgi:hypothetical protein